MSAVAEESPEWKTVLDSKLRLFGHRNWIVIADAAYPAQSAPGITTILAAGEHVDVVRTVIEAIAAAKHLKTNIYADRELELVIEPDAPGIERLREKLTGVVRWSDVRSIPHEEIIRKLDEAARRFEVLILKTGLTIPYTSVFLELDCGYWSAEAEARLRRAVV
jgi:L-fucose mutarotase/ribose pyranase (RbsD/FucU family)